MNPMRRLSLRGKDRISERIREIDGRLSRIRREMRELNRVLRHPSRQKRPLESVGQRLVPPVMPESKKRFVSYLSAGSFQTISLRRHEQRSARVRAFLAVAAVIVFVFLLVYFFLRLMSG